MKRFFCSAAMLLFAVASLTACGSSAEERHAAKYEREKLHEERKEINEEREHQSKVERDCVVSYNTCIARCDELLYATTRSACVSDCATVRSQCLETK